MFLDPDFLTVVKNFGDLRTFEADIGLLNICMDFQDLLAENTIGLQYVVSLVPSLQRKQTGKA